jgi:hypothetical protein
VLDIETEEKVSPAHTDPPDGHSAGGELDTDAT